MNNCVCLHKFYVELRRQIPKKQHVFSGMQMVSVSFLTF